MPAHEVPRLFERFHRVEGAQARTHEGTGIGLALVKDLVELHGGTVEVASTHGEGTTFTVRIPLGAAHLPAERVLAQPTQGTAPPLTAVGAAPFVEEALRWMAPASVEAAPEPDGAGARARILVADDNADMRDYIVRLVGARWAVETAGDGAAALEAARRTPARPDPLGHHDAAPGRLRPAARGAARPGPAAHAGHPVVGARR